jgi:hypothetical protein
MGGTTFTWFSKKQFILTLFTYEAEYVTAPLGVTHAIWLGRLLQELKCPQFESIEIRVGNKSAIELAKNPVHHWRVNSGRYQGWGGSSCSCAKQ